MHAESQTLAVLVPESSRSLAFKVRARPCAAGSHLTCVPPFFGRSYKTFFFHMSRMPCSQCVRNQPPTPTNKHQTHRPALGYQKNEPAQKPRFPRLHGATDHWSKHWKQCLAQDLRSQVHTLLPPEGGRGKRGGRVVTYLIWVKVVVMLSSM